jgi:hypothetical protein
MNGYQQYVSALNSCCDGVGCDRINEKRAIDPDFPRQPLPSCGLGLVWASFSSLSSDLSDLQTKVEISEEKLRNELVQAITNQTNEINALRGQVQVLQAASEESGFQFDESLGIAGGAALVSCAALVFAIVVAKKRAQSTTAALTNTTTAKVDC